MPLRTILLLIATCIGISLFAQTLMLGYCAHANVYVDDPAAARRSELQSESSGPKHPLPHFRKTNAKALLMGDATLYDSSLTSIRELGNYNGYVVDVIAVSDKYYVGFDEYQGDTCVRFRYARIRHKDFEGIIKGRHIYRVINSPQNREIRIGNQYVKMLATSSYVEKEEWNPDCVIDTYNETPLLFVDSRYGYNGPVHIINGDEFRLNTSYMELAINKNDKNAVPVRVVGEGFETEILLRFPTAPEKGDEPPGPSWIEIRRDSHGTYTAFIHSKNE